MGKESVKKNTHKIQKLTKANSITLKEFVYITMNIKNR